MGGHWLVGVPLLPSQLWFLAPAVLQPQPLVLGRLLSGVLSEILKQIRVKQCPFYPQNLEPSLLPGSVLVMSFWKTHSFADFELLC